MWDHAVFPYVPSANTRAFCQPWHEKGATKAESCQQAQGEVDRESFVKYG